MLSRAISLRVISPVTSLETSTYVDLRSDYPRQNGNERTNLKEIEREAYIPKQRWVIGAQGDVDALVHEDRQRMHRHGSRISLTSRHEKADYFV